ncbi:MAG TPA: hypothetical protein PKK48_04360 [Phycisphaerae bacterium]|nr:hypothetical protein [Phycisphaerae bacterium]HPS53688.1 hypothetical protein [Phycisphaerae bacterium]
MNNVNFSTTWKNILGLTAAGFLGMAVFVMIIIAISPILLIAGIWLFIQKIKFNHMLRKAAGHGNVVEYAVDVNPSQNASDGFTAKHVDVTVIDESGNVL